MYRIVPESIVIIVSRDAIGTPESHFYDFILEDLGLNFCNFEPVEHREMVAVVGYYPLPSGTALRPWMQCRKTVRYKGPALLDVLIPVTDLVELSSV